MEQMPSSEKFSPIEVSELMARLLSDDVLDEKGMEEVITVFLKNHGYSPNREAVSELSKSFHGEISFENFKNKLEKSVREH